MMKSLGSGRGNHWRVSADHVDMTAPAAPPRPVSFPARPQSLTLDLDRTALLVIDMQNDFCTPGGWVDHIGGDYGACRKPIPALKKLLPALRRSRVPVVWVNWGNRPDLANMSPNQHHIYKRSGQGIGLADPLPGSGAQVLTKDSWAAAQVDDLPRRPGDYAVDKYRISGFWDTPLDSILKNLGCRTLLFAGVNTDQCVFCTLTDANFLGYACVLLEDCCASNSPDFAEKGAIWNVQQCFGFVARSPDLLAGLKAAKL